MIAEVQKYVPGYTLKNGPVFDGKRVSSSWKSQVSATTCRRYAGNLDIMTAAALRTGEMFAEEILSRRLVPPAAEEQLMNLSRPSSSPLHDMTCATACTPSGTRSPSSR